MIAAGATFAAFPAWYATMFSALLPRAAAHPRAADRARGLVRVARARRGRPLARRVALGEHRRAASARRSSGAWRWRASSTASRSTANGDFTGNVLDLFNAYTVAAGVAVVLLFALHGATFLTLRADGRAARAGGARPRGGSASRRRSSWPRSSPGPSPSRSTATDATVLAPPGPGGVGVIALALAGVLARARAQRVGVRDHRLASLSVVATLFTALYPRVLVSGPNPRTA